MLRQLLVGGAASLANIAIHALVMTIVVRVARANVVQVKTSSSLLLVAVMVPTVSVLMLTHACEVLVWSLFYGIFNAAPAGTDLVYFAFVNYTTLGYGDIVMSPRWRLLGPQEAASGTLAFGWSTAALVTVVIRLFRYRHLALVGDERRGRSQETRDPKPARQ